MKIFKLGVILLLSSIVIIFFKLEFKFHWDYIMLIFGIVILVVEFIFGYLEKKLFEISELESRWE